MTAGEEDQQQRISELRTYATGLTGRVLRPPEGALAHPYLEPGAGYAGQLWDWDAYFTALALSALAPGPEVRRTVRGCVANFADRTLDDGSLPFRVLAEEADAGQDRQRRDQDTPFNSAKPVLAQLALLGAEDGPAGDAWLAEVVQPLARHVRHWEATQLSRHGLFVWRSHRGSGADNHPAVYGRPQDSVAGTDLNSLFVLEYAALARICARLGRAGQAAAHTAAQEKLADRIRRLLWDPVDGLFHHADTLGATPAGVTQEVTRPTPLKYRSWTAFYPLWAGVATREQAGRTVAAALADGGLFCAHGVRTLSATEPLYHLDGTGNPSNWQGPVWIVANHIVSRGLAAYGFAGLAGQVAGATVRVLSDDLRAGGRLHECYHPESGRGLTNPGFLGWNLLGAVPDADQAAR